LRFTTYNVAVELLGNDQFTPEESWQNVRFRMVYINEFWTEAQFILRGVFSLISLVVFITFASKLIQKHHRSQITSEMK
jgi:hypothetical protein